MGEYMKVEYIDDKIIIYTLEHNIDSLEDYCNELVDILTNNYNVKLKGFYHVNAYIDKEYGTVFEFNLEDRDLYIDFSKIDLHIIKYDVSFLFEVEDILDIDCNKFIIYENKYYINSKSIDNNNIEFVKLVYRNTDKIRKNGILLCK